MTQEFWLELGLPTQGRFRVDNMGVEDMRVLGRMVSKHYQRPQAACHQFEDQVMLTTEVTLESYQRLWDEQREELGEIVSLCVQTGENLKIRVYEEKLDLDNLPKTLLRLINELEVLRMIQV